MGVNDRGAAKCSLNRPGPQIGPGRFSRKHRQQGKVSKNASRFRRHVGLDFVVASAHSLDGWLFHQFVGISDRNRQVRAAKIFQNGEVHTNDLAVPIEERTA